MCGIESFAIGISSTQLGGGRITLDLRKVQKSGYGNAHILDALEQVADRAVNGELFETITLSKYHKKHSRPIMKKLKEWIEQQFEEKLVEPNSGLGGALKYLKNHWEKLTLFLKDGRAPLDN